MSAVPEGNTSADVIVWGEGGTFAHLSRRHCFGFIVHEYKTADQTSGQNYGQQYAHELRLLGDKTLLIS
jgi:hypothetical protein